MHIAYLTKVKSKIISIDVDHFTGIKKQRPLTPLMIAALLSACAKQKEGLGFGPSDIKGSLVSLINRGLITRKKVPLHDENVSWEVTPEAVAMLKAIGIETAC